MVVVSTNNSKDFLILVFASRFTGGKVPLVYGNLFGNSLVGLGLFKSEFNPAKPVLLFGGFNSEAEPIHLPMYLPQ